MGAEKPKREANERARKLLLSLSIVSPRPESETVWDVTDEVLGGLSASWK
jgi:hypothetical protein